MAVAAGRGESSIKIKGVVRTKIILRSIHWTRS